jgi:thiol:disulfide interchange protein DsbC
VVFEPHGAVQRTITVFTDVDCGYCRAMHREIDALLGAGVRVRYLLYPRDGPGSPGVARPERVWCAADRQDALTRAKLGEQVESPDCESPVFDNLMLDCGIAASGGTLVVQEVADPGGLRVRDRDVEAPRAAHRQRQSVNERCELVQAGPVVHAPLQPRSSA